jgi:hypothetical protein
VRLEIQLPKRIEVSDYPDFGYLREYFHKLNKHIRVKNMGIGRSRSGKGYLGGCYIGIVYVGKFTWMYPENMLMVEKIKKDLQ